VRIHLPNDKIELINDKDLFKDNCHIIAMLKPVIDAIGSIESDSSTLAHIWESVIDQSKI